MTDTVYSCSGFVSASGCRFALVSTGFSNVAHIVMRSDSSALCRARAIIFTSVSDRRVCPKCLKILQSIREGAVNA